MRLSLKDLKIILNWFEIASSDLGDADLKVYDKIHEYVEEHDEEDNNGKSYIYVDDEEYESFKDPYEDDDNDY